MRVLIPGGTGKVGRRVAQEFTAAGYEVIVLSRDPERAHGLPAGVQVVGWDARTAKGWYHLAEGAAAIINLAGEDIGAGRWTAKRKERIRQSRIDAGRAVVEAVQAVAVKPRTVVQASAVGYYGSGLDGELTEEAAPGTDFLAQICREWEESTAPVEALGVRRVIVRLGVVLTMAGGALPRMLLPFKFFVGGPLGSGQQWFPWIHVADVASAIRFLVQSEGASGPFNLAAPDLLTNAGFARTLGRVMRRPAVMPAPSFAIRLVFGEMAMVVLEGQRATPQRLLQAGYPFRFAEAEPALRDLLR